MQNPDTRTPGMFRFSVSPKRTRYLRKFAEQPHGKLLCGLFECQIEAMSFHAFPPEYLSSEGITPTCSDHWQFKYNVILVAFHEYAASAQYQRHLATGIHVAHFCSPTYKKGREYPPCLHRIP